MYRDVSEQVTILRRLFKDGLYCEVTSEWKVNEEKAQTIQDSGGRTFRKRNEQGQRHSTRDMLGVSEEQPRSVSKDCY